MTHIEFALMAALMHQNRRIAAVSWLLAAVALAWLTLASPACAPQRSSVLAVAASLAASLVQTWYAIRADIDARLFDALAARETTLEALDDGLVALGMLAPGRRGRDWPARLRGARRLLAAQAVYTVAQAAALAVGIVGGDVACWHG